MLDMLLTPFAFLGIRHPDKKLVTINWIAPLSLAAICTICLCIVDQMNFFGSNGFLEKILGLVQSLPGFYLAALIAVTAFSNGPGMDKLMPGIPPTGKIWHNGSIIREELTRRRMLSMMFAFLTASSFLLTFAIILSTSLANPAYQWIRSTSDALWVANIATGVKCLVIFSLLTALWQMLLVTLWGLFYLSDRIHEPDS